MSDTQMDQVIWTGRQWRVTTSWLEEIRQDEVQPYSLSVEDLWTGHQDVSASMMVHVITKNWVDEDEFIQAYLIACVVHGIKLPNVGQVVDEARKMKAAVSH